MSKTRGTPFDDGRDSGHSIRDPFAEFVSESEIERPARTPDELELQAPEDVAAEALDAGRSRSFGWPLLTGVAVIGLVAGSLIGVMTRGRALPSDERLVQPAGSAAVSPLRSAPVVTHGAAPAKPVIEPVASPTSSRLRSAKRSKIDSRAVALPRVTAAAGPPASAAHQPSSNDVEAIRVVTPAHASLLPDPVPASPTANPAIPTTALAPTDARVIATASDPDRDELTYRWTAPVGRFANAMARETVYTCPDTPIAVELTVTVTDGHGGIASDMLTIHCVEHR